MQLQLGMSRDDVISKLAANYRLTRVQSPADDWIVAEKQNAEIWQGYLGFHDGKLTFASRSWTQGNEDTFAFAQALWRAMSEMDREGHNACSFDVPTTNSPTAETGRPLLGVHGEVCSKKDLTGPTLLEMSGFGG
jgi:hypothetical protein